MTMHGSVAELELLKTTSTQSYRYDKASAPNQLSRSLVTE